MTTTIYAQVMSLLKSAYNCSEIEIVKQEETDRSFIIHATGTIISPISKINIKLEISD